MISSTPNPTAVGNLSDKGGSLVSRTLIVVRSGLVDSSSAIDRIATGIDDSLTTSFDLGTRRQDQTSIETWSSYCTAI